MSHDISFCEHGEDLLQWRIGVTNVHHQRQPNRFRCLFGQTEGLQVVLTGQGTRQPDLHSQNDVTVLFDRPDRQPGIGVTKVQQLAVGVIARPGGLADD